MAIPATPNNVLIQQGNGQVYLTWDQSVGAISYSIQRSIDGGLSYSVVASPTLLNYLDTTALINTAYFYQVAAVNSSGTSNYSSPQGVTPTLTGQNSLGEIRLRAQQRADMVGSNFVSQTEWNYYINASSQELYDLLITVYEDYYIAPRQLLTFNSGSNMYPLPDGQIYSAAPAFYKLYGVDCGLDGNNQAYITLKKYSFIERNRYVFPQLQTSFLGVFNLQYRVLGNNLSVIPTPTIALQIGIWYFPRLKVLLQDTDVLDGVSGWTEYVIIDAARKALAKQESDTSVLMNEKMMMRSRIEESASNRDAGQPERISSTRSLGTGAGGDWANGWANGPSAGF